MTLSVSKTNLQLIFFYFEPTDNPKFELLKKTETLNKVGIFFSLLLFLPFFLFYLFICILSFLTYYIYLQGEITFRLGSAGPRLFFLVPMAAESGLPSHAPRAVRPHPVASPAMSTV